MKEVRIEDIKINPYAGIYFDTPFHKKVPAQTHGDIIVIGKYHKRYGIVTLKSDPYFRVTFTTEKGLKIALKKANKQITKK